MYRELIEKLIEGHSWAKLQEPCSERDITKAEEYVGFSFPEELKALLRETNGDRNFLLSAEEIISNTKNNREIFPEFLEAEEFEEKVNRFVFFATNGCGDYYCYRVLENGETGIKIKEEPRGAACCLFVIGEIFFGINIIPRNMH